MNKRDWMVAVDVGGTFTDGIAVSGEGQVKVAKVPSTPADPALALLATLGELGQQGMALGSVTALFHGTTVATNTVLAGRLSRVVLVCTEGTRDLLSIRTGRRPKLYDLEQPKPLELVRRRDRIEVAERVLGSGEVKTRLTKAEIGRVVSEVERRDPEAVAVALLFSYFDDRHERLLAEAIGKRLPHVPVTVSSSIAREFREYPRTATAVINAGLRPVVGSYLLEVGRELKRMGVDAPFLIMQSNGGSVPAERADREAHRMLLSGPTAGVAAATALATRYELDGLVSLDMGGTSLDVCLVQDRRPAITPIQRVDVHPLLCPSVDVITVGAGGGSLVFVESSGRLQVGPQSAGAEPGPAAYRRGGTQATLTDAHVVAGTLGSAPLAGKLPLDRQASVEAVARIADGLGLSIDEAAQGIIAVAVAKVVRGLRRVSIERGVDPRGFTLVAFGGAGPLHAGLLMREMGFRSAVIPPYPGLFSASGLLAADLRMDESQTVLRLLGPEAIDDLLGWFRETARRLSEQLRSGPVASRRIRILGSLDCRYAGQGFELNVPLAGIDRPSLDRAVAHFHRLHRQTYGHSGEDKLVEVVTLRLSAFGDLPRPRPSLARTGPARPPAREAKVGDRKIGIAHGGRGTVPIFRRELLRSGNRLEGPAVIEQMDSTTMLLATQRATVDAAGNLWLHA
jgi:N-methylhydantoinase A